MTLFAVGFILGFVAFPIVGGLLLGAWECWEDRCARKVRGRARGETETEALSAATEKWNRRAPDSRLVNTLKRLHDAVHEDETTSGFEYMTWLGLVRAWQEVERDAPDLLKACGVGVKRG